MMNVLISLPYLLFWKFIEFAIVSLSYLIGFAVHYSQGSNLVVQRDGSAYHSLFVPEDACSDTLVENFSSLLDS